MERWKSGESGLIKKDSIRESKIIQVIFILSYKVDLTRSLKVNFNRIF